MGAGNWAPTVYQDEVKLQLLGNWASPFAYRARIALNLKGVKYHYMEEDLKNKSELLLASNPIHKQVPVLIHDGRAICESLLILQYIDEVWSDAEPALFPSDPYERAIVRFWAAYIDDKLFPSLRGSVIAQTEEAKLEAIAQASTSLELLDEAFKKLSEGKLFFGGDSIGYLDIVLGSFITWIKTVEKMFGVKFVDEMKVPSLVEWGKRFSSAECVKGVMGEVDKLEVYAKVRHGHGKPSASTQ